MKKGLYLILIYILIFRTQQKNEELFDSEKETKNKIDLNRPAYDEKNGGNTGFSDSLVFITSVTKTIPAENILCSPMSKETRKPLLAQ